MYGASAPPPGPGTPPAAPPMPSAPAAAAPRQLDPRFLRCNQSPANRAWLRCKTSDVDLCYDCACVCPVCKLWPLSPQFLDPRDHLCQPDGVPAFVAGDEVGEEEFPSAGTPRELGDAAAGPVDPHLELRHFANAVHREMLMQPETQHRSVSCAQLAADLLVMGADTRALQRFVDAVDRLRPPLLVDPAWSSFWRGGPAPPSVFDVHFHTAPTPGDPSFGRSAALPGLNRGEVHTRLVVNYR